MTSLRLGLGMAACACLSACATSTSPVVTVAPVTPAPIVAVDPPHPPEPPKPPSGMQWMYGSGEGAASSIQTYRAFTDYVLEAKRKRPADSVVLAGGDLAAGRFEPCGRKPLAVILDVDETALQNLGYEYALAARGKSSDRALIDRWQHHPQTAAAAMPGAVESLNKLRTAGITVVFNSNRDNVDAAGTAATIEKAGLGTAVPGRTLLLRGDVDGKGGKDGRRSFVASRYCVVAMAGDQLADFADGFNDRALRPLARRALAQRFAGKWGNGWFLLSNPVYGPGLSGGVDDIFAPDVRWTGEN